MRDALAADGLIFKDPEAGWQTADAYLSGNVKRKLATAQRAMVARAIVDGVLSYKRLVERK